MSSYSSLTTYRKCPRLYGFGLLGYKPIEIPEAIQTGSFVHTAIAAHFRNADWQLAIDTVWEEACNLIQKSSLEADKATKALKSTSASLKRAKDLASRYISQWTADYSAPLVETWVELGPVRGIIDLIAYYQEQRVIVDYKTSKSPDMRWYDVSGQIDLYAYLLSKQNKGEAPASVIYDIISDEGIYRQARPPRLEAGQGLYIAISNLPEAVEGSVDVEIVTGAHLTFDCPQRCDFWLPCWLMETADWSACEDYLNSNFIKEEK